MSFKVFIKNKILQLGALIYRNNDSKIIYYHDVHQEEKIYTDMSTSLTLFKQHMLAAKEQGYVFVNEIKSPKNQLMITFDDGFRGLYENFNFFIENEIPVKLFLITDFIGKENYVTVNEVKEMLASGFLSIGSHTCSHEDMTLQTIGTLEREMGESKKILESTFNVKIDAFCFPRGFYNETIVEIGEKVGYRRLYSSIPGSFSMEAFVVKRNLVQDVNVNALTHILNGALEIFAGRYRKQHVKG